MLRDTSIRDLSVTLFGEKYETPILCALVGEQTIFHSDQGIGIAEVAAEIGVPYLLSTAASSTIEEVARANRRG